MTKRGSNNDTVSDSEIGWQNNLGNTTPVLIGLRTDIPLWLRLRTDACCSFIMQPSEQGPDLPVPYLRKGMILQGADFRNQDHTGKS